MRVAVARALSADPMGQGNADESLIQALLADPSPHEIGHIDVVGRRSQAPGNRRLPLGRLQAAPWGVQLAVGTWTYRRSELVHRLDLGLPPAAMPEVLTVQDLAPLRFADEGRMPHTAARSIRRAAAVVCPSDFSAREVRSVFGREDVEVIPHGIDPAFLSGRGLSPAQRRELGLSGRWIVHSGGATIRKNLQGLAAAWPSVRSVHPDVTLVLCGPPHPRRSELFGGLDGVRMLGKVPKRTLVGLVGSAAAVVVPSSYEGYGLPVLEAMASGVPVVTTTAASLPEVAGPGAVLVGIDGPALAAGICRALDGVDQPVLEEARDLARTRTWAVAARAYKQLYSRIAGGPSVAA